MNLKNENGKVIVNTEKFSLELDWLFNLLIDASGKIMDALIKGEELSEDQEKLTQTLDAIAKIWGHGAVKDTETEIDDKGLEVLLQLFADTAGEGSFPLAKF